MKNKQPDADTIRARLNKERQEWVSALEEWNKCSASYPPIARCSRCAALRAKLRQAGARTTP